MMHKNGGGSLAQGVVVIRQTGIRSGSETGFTLPALFQPDAATAKRVLEFFTANIRNPNTRKAYARAAGAFATWCEGRGLEASPQRAAYPCGGLYRRTAAADRGSFSQGAARRHPHALRLACPRSDRAQQPRQRGSWAEVFSEERQNPNTLCRRSPHPPRFNRDA